MRLSLRQDGAALMRGAARGLIDTLAELFQVNARAGERLTSTGQVSLELASTGIIGSIAAEYLGPAARPVRAIAFDKSVSANWALGWHQDRTICVAQRHDVPGFGPWSTKHGLQHVAPPFSLLERMITLRVHIDSVDKDNGPLLIALGSHAQGLIAEADIAGEVGQSRRVACMADAGDVWVYSTPILHASDRVTPGRRRRVLQIDYSAEMLPRPLEWLGID